MAFDKVVDSSVLDAGLKQIADAIRAKAGTSGNMAFPTAMAEAIAAIEAGGGSGGMSSGTITFSENTPVSGYTIAHGITYPKLFVIAGVTGTKAAGSLHTWLRCWSTMFSGVHVSISNNNATLYMKANYSSFPSNSISLTSLYSSGEYFVANTQYWWVCYSEEV